MTAPGITACDRALRRAWLLARLAGHLDTARGDLPRLLALGDEALIVAVGGRQAGSLIAEWRAFRAAAARERYERAGVAAVCRCAAAYPPRLRALVVPPAVLHIAGDPAALDPARRPGPAVAVVGTRRPSAYGRTVAHRLCADLVRAGGSVVSGMAAGIDAAAHDAALAEPAAAAEPAAGAAVAVMPGGAERPYPAANRHLHGRVVAAGAAVSELPPGAPVRRWGFLARNRLIAALAEATVVVEARVGSGSLVTAAEARALGRPVGAVPGAVTSPLAAGPHALLRDGGRLVAGIADVFALVGRPAPAGARARGGSADREHPASGAGPAPRTPAGHAALWAAIGTGGATPAELEQAGFPALEVLAGLAALELGGQVERAAGGRFHAVM